MFPSRDCVTEVFMTINDSHHGIYTCYKHCVYRRYVSLVHFLFVVLNQMFVVEEYLDQPIQPGHGRVCGVIIL